MQSAAVRERVAVKYFADAQTDLLWSSLFSLVRRASKEEHDLFWLPIVVGRLSDDEEAVVPLFDSSTATD